MRSKLPDDPFASGIAMVLAMANAKAIAAERVGASDFCVVAQHLHEVRIGL